MTWRCWLWGHLLVLRLRGNIYYYCCTECNQIFSLEDLQGYHRLKKTDDVSLPETLVTGHTTAGTLSPMKYGEMKGWMTTASVVKGKGQ